MTERPTDEPRTDQQPEQEAEATFPPILPEDMSDETRKALAEPGSARNAPAPTEGAEGGEWGRAVPGPEDPEQWGQSGSGQDNGSME